ncbi:putative mechanosensitive ion channel protein [Azorhizobium caulinodans ORS 571]|uniref:Putative mechanosensitive ion channel protein n=1 Tax=Azorhizobium caulinodans (strain ATCC 43989 / DSM 5975 / JCM 20966 / LMG 6465 / NBRC 14845 / NCIMB 13405 / ORS 571) TaxID=438753 RepID=A8I3Q5_AZOC5|nr:mechanosensitive ion channel family protein [Azorhizobium caulinodans]BAF87640.1 putative mechanosensitive ion channel protein [Azorhizobium caulinodans ORS 571]
MISGGTGLADELRLLIADPMVPTAVAALAVALGLRLALRDRPWPHLIGQVALLTLLTALLTSEGIVPYEAGAQAPPSLHGGFMSLAKVVWWSSAALCLAGFVRMFLIFERRPREGRLLQDLLVGVIYVGAALSVVADVFSVPVGTLIATSGVVAIVLGLALQSTLADLFSGIALNISRPYGVGDWVILPNGVEGRVIETNWRATHLLSSGNDLVILPNSNLAKEMLTNASGPERRHGVKLRVRLVPTLAPLALARVLRDALSSSTLILSHPAPAVHIKTLDAQAVDLELSFHVAELGASSAAKDEMFDLVYRHAKAAGLHLAAPAGAGGDSVPRSEVSQRPLSLRLLDSVALFSSLSEEEKAALADAMEQRAYRKDEVVAREGEVLSVLMIVRSGILGLTRSADAPGAEIHRLAPGDLIGEEGVLLGEGEAGTVRALTYVVAFAIAKEALAPLLKDRPGLADELGALLAQRRETAHLEAAAPCDREWGRSRLAEGIRAFMQVHRGRG